MKRISSRLSLFFTILVLLVGCESRESHTEVAKTDTKVSSSVTLSDKEVKDILNRLVPKALVMYGIFNGTGSFKVDVAKTIPGEAGTP